MNKNTIEDKLIKILKKNNKLNKIYKNIDLYRIKIIDSFDVISIIEEIDNLFEINLNLAEKKN